MIPPELFEFLESGVSILVGTRSARLLPEPCRAAGVRVESEGRELTVFLPEVTSEAALANLRENGRIAVCLARVDHRSVQIKGQVVAIQAASTEDRDRIQRHRRALAEALGIVGIPPRITLRTAHWPAHAVRLRVESVFDQTPGPGAGNALSPPTAGTRT